MTWRSSVVEVAGTRERQRLYYLPDEGSHFFQYHRTLVHLQRSDIGKETEKLTFRGWGDIPRQLVEG